MPGDRELLALSGTATGLQVGVLRALPGLGDLLTSVPALRALRAGLPDGSRILLVGLPAASWFPMVFPRLVDELVVVDAWPDLPEAPGSWEEAHRFAAAVRARHLDLAVQLHGSGPQSNVLLGALGARRLAGSHPPGTPAPPGAFVPYEDHGHEIHRLLRVARALGFPDRGDHLEWPDPGPPPLPGGYVCLHPGASVPSRRWDRRGFVAVGRRYARRGLRVVVTGGSAERDLTAWVAEGIGPAAVDLGGRTDLPTLAALLHGSLGLVTNDTGVSHLAAALAVPSVVLFLSSDPGRWAPLDRARHAALVAADVTVDAVVAALDDRTPSGRGLSPARGAPAS